MQSDEIDEEGPNQPPIARDDDGQTRVDRPIDLDVLLNDTDPNGDVLVVASVEPTGGDGARPDRARRAQRAGLAGRRLRRHHHVRLHDHRRSRRQRVGRRDGAGGAVGRQRATVHPRRTTTSPRHGAAGPTTFDVLGNDVDPDGDALVLDSIALKDPAAAAGQLVPDPSGQVVFTPDPNTTSERIELTYTVSDDFGATDEGTVIVSVRLEDANNEPDARNDAGVTVVGKPIRLDVLENDTDPDNDPLFVAQQPTLVRPTDRTADSLDLTLTPDGELFFNPDTAGTFVFTYAATDGEETDVAQIRIEVGAAAENRPPTAIRDDVVIPAGGSRLVYVMDNDGDPDGDVIGLAGYDVDDGNGLTVKEVEGVGYLVTVAPGAAARPTFRYRISDGRSDPVSAVVVVAVTDDLTVDQPPVARADVTEVRAGGKVHVPVLENDYDPEGGVLQVVDVTPWEGVDVAPGLNGQTVDVRVGAGVISSFTLSYTVVDTAGNRAERVRRRAHRPARRGQPPADRPHRHLAHQVRRRCRDPCRRQRLGPRRRHHRRREHQLAAHGGRGERRGRRDHLHAERHVRRHRPPHVRARRRRRRDRHRRGAHRRDAAVGGEPGSGGVRRRGPGRSPAAPRSSSTCWTTTRTPTGTASACTTVGAPTTGAAEVAEEADGVVFTPPSEVAARGADVAFTYAIDDGRGGTAQATVNVEVIAAGAPLAPVAVDDLVGPIAPGQSVEVDLLANDLDPDGNPAELVVASDDPALADRDGSTVTIVAGPASTRHVYTITDPDGLTDTAEVDVLVVPNRAPLVQPHAVQTAANTPITIDLTAQATDPDGDTLYYSLLRQPAGRGRRPPSPTAPGR